MTLLIRYLLGDSEAKFHMFRMMTKLHPILYVLISLKNSVQDRPEVTEEQMAGARLRIGGRPVPKGKVSVLVDAEIVAYFRMKAGDENYESVINEMLKAGIRDSGITYKT